MVCTKASPTCGGGHAVSVGATALRSVLTGGRGTPIALYLDVVMYQVALTQSTRRSCTTERDMVLSHPAMQL